MPVTMSGMSSGMDTDAIVEKLVNVEARPIKLLEISKKNHNVRKDGLKSLGKVLDEVNATAKELYGFRASYNDKNVVSSDTSVLDAKAGMNADKGVKKIKVNQIAAAHRVTSDSIVEKETLPSGTFTIEVDGEKKSVKFKGGTLKDLSEKIEETASDLVITSYIRKDGDAYVLTLQSKKTGQKGEIKLTGDRELLTKIGLVGGEGSGKTTEAAVTFDSRYFTSYLGEKKADAENGTIRVEEGGRSVSVQGLLWREYALPVEMTVKGDSRLEFEVTYRDRSNGGEDGIPKRLQVGPKEKINIKGIILEGYNPERKREGDKVDKKEYDSLMGVGLVAVENGKRVERIYPMTADAKGTRTIEAGKDFKGGRISKIVLYCNRGVMDVANIRMATPAEKKDWLEMKNTIAQPQDAKIIIDGVEITRDRNDNLTDVIKGVTLNLKKASHGEIDLNIEHSTDASIDKIKKFVDAYNKFLDFERELTKAAITQKPGEYDKAVSQQGLFMGDMTIMRLESSLKMTVNAAYTSSVDKHIKMLSQMGVSTGAINAEWQSIKAGRLVVDEALLKKTILENPDGVASFFGTDTDGDNKADNGMAVKVVTMLKPFVTPGKNIIAAKMELEDNSIKMADESIKAKEEHLKKYEEKLKRKFAAMEQAISQTNSQKQWLKQQMGGGDDSGGREK
jgi:flagellar hook-associated protein 2